MNRSIAPIFNITKRPRQALVSDPCDSQSITNREGNGSASINTGPQQMPQAQSKAWHQGRTTPSQMGLLPPKPSLSQYQSRRTTTQGSQRGGQPSPQATQKQDCSRGAHSATNATSFNGRRGQSPQSSFQRRHMFNQNQTNMSTESDSHGTNQRRFSGTQASPRNVPQKRGYQQANYEEPRSFPLHQSNSGFSASAQKTSKQAASAVSQFNTQAYNRSQVQMQQNKCRDNPQPGPSTSYRAAPVTKQKQFGSTKQETDKSLRVMTATIHTVKQWGNSAHAVPVLFEVHGMTASAITTNRQTKGKEFLLKDETGVVPCVFFEIDRPLDRLTRGQWHRCMGAYDRKMEKFKCVSVRMSSPAERSLAKVSAKVSEQTLACLVMDLRET